MLALLAFAFDFGDMMVMPQPYSRNTFGKSVSLLKELPETEESFDTYKPKFEAVTNLIKTTLNVTKCIVELREAEAQNIINVDQSWTAHAVYWPIRCIVGCASQILGLTGMGYKYICLSFLYHSHHNYNISCYSATTFQI